MPEIIVKLGDNVVQKYFFVQESMSVGRAPDNEIVIENLAVSRAHSVIRREEEHYVVTDLGSSNGTYVNGVKVKKTELVDKDVITIGKHKLHFYDGQVAPKKERSSSMQDVEGTMMFTQASGAEIEVTKGRQKGQRFDLSKDTVTIGRGPNNDIRLSDWFVSKDHAIIEHSEGEYMLKDLDSWRHTTINGEQVQNAILNDGDVIQLGPTVQLQFQLLGAAAGGGARVPVEMSSQVPGLTDEPMEEDSPSDSKSSTGNHFKTDYIPFDEDVARQQAAAVVENVDVSDDVADEVMENMAEMSVQAAADATSGEDESNQAVEDQPEDAVGEDFFAGDPFASDNNLSKLPEVEQPEPEAIAELPAEEDQSMPDAVDLNTGADLAPMDENQQQVFDFGTGLDEEEAAEANNPLESEVYAGEDEARSELAPEAQPEVESQDSWLDSPADAEEEDQQPEASNEAVAEEEEPMAEAVESEVVENQSGADEDQDEAKSEEVLMWERALQNKSPLIRKQAARHLKKLTGKDYDY